MNLAFERKDVERELTAAAIEVLETMFFASLEKLEAGAVFDGTAGRIGAALSFHGACKGSLSISLDRKAAHELTASFFGENVTADDGLGEATLGPDDDAAVMAEIANMVCGAMLSRLERKAIFALGTPTPLAPGAEPIGWIEKDMALNDSILRLAFSLDRTDWANRADFADCVDFADCAVPQ